MPPSVEREIGRLETRLASLETDVASMASDIREIREAMHTVRGGWRALTILIAVSSGLGAIVGTFWPLVDRQ